MGDCLLIPSRQSRDTFLIRKALDCRGIIDASRVTVEKKFLYIRKSTAEAVLFFDD